MASIFKTTTVAYRDTEGRKCTKDAPGARKIRIVSKVYYGRYKTPGGKSRTVRLCANKRDSETLLAKLATDAVMDKADLRDKFATQRYRPLTEHVEDFRSALLAKNNSEKHARQTVTRALAIIEGCGFDKLADVQEADVLE